MQVSPQQRFGWLAWVWMAGWMTGGGTAWSMPASQDDAWARGEELVSERNCVACHSVSDAATLRLNSKSSPDLTQVGSRVAPGYLRRFLQDPRATHPHTTMPDVLHAANDEDIDLLVHFLAGLGEPFDASAHGASASEIELGRRLFHSVGCVACHLPEEELWELELPFDQVRRLREQAEDEPEAADDDGQEFEEPYVMPGVLAPRDLPLDHLAGKTNVGALTKFLLDPLHVRASGRMPNLGLTDDEARAIALYLLRAQIERDSTEPSPGLLAERFENDMPFDPDFKSLVPVDTILVDTISIEERRVDNQFGFRFTGLVEVPEDGSWTWHVRSDDGSRLWIDGDLVVDNWFQHAPAEKSGTRKLRAGVHAIEVHFFESGGGEELEVEWEGPGFERGPIDAKYLSHVGLRYQPPRDDFVRDPQRAVRGASVFLQAGCVACHDPDAVGVRPAMQAKAGPLASRAKTPGDACLGGSASSESHWALEDDDRAAVLGFLRSDALNEPLAEHARLDHDLHRMGCVHCHRRDEFGGVHPFNRDYFKAAEGADLGEEGRIPPDLTGVGAKLRPATLERVLNEGDSVRPYMTTRMPHFGQANVGSLAALFDRVDEDFEFDRVVPPTGDTLQSAVRLVGIKGGLGCIQCHDFAGTPSLGIRAVDLAHMYERLEPGWFRAMLLDPQSVSTGTRMATLWDDGLSPVRDVYAGEPLHQVDAIWHLLSLGDGMPRPIGLEASDAEFELLPESGALSCGVFMRDLSPRTVVVGFPELVHFAYDIEHGRLGKAWRGRFFNASGTWKGRAGLLQIPPSAEAYEPPDGMPLAAFPAGPQVHLWPEAVGKDAGFSAWRRTFAEDDTPTFWSTWDARVVAETLVPRKGGDTLERTFEVWSADPDEALWLRVDPNWTGVLHGPDGDVFAFGGEHGFPMQTHPDRVLKLHTRGGGVEYRVRLAAQPDVAPKPGLDNVYRVTLELKW